MSRRVGTDAVARIGARLARVERAMCQSGIGDVGRHIPDDERVLLRLPFSGDPFQPPGVYVVPWTPHVTIEIYDSDLEELGEGEESAEVGGG